MKFAKRRGKDAPEGDGAVQAPRPADPPVTENSPAAGDPPEHSTPPPGPAAAQAPEPAPAPDPAPEPEPEPVATEAEAFVEGEAVELPYEPPVVEEPPPFEPPAAGTPIYPHPIDPEPVVSVAASTPHHEPGLIPGDTEIRPRSGGAWPEPAFDLAERPEILVGAAFGGGILLALILRRLGN